MTLAETRTLLAYDAWANALTFEAVAALPADEPTRPVAGSFPTLTATLAHIVGVEWAWLRRWQGEHLTGYPDWVTTPDLADLRARLSAVEKERGVFMAGLSDADLAREISYRLMSGAEHADKLGDLIGHLINHSTYHRGQVASQLRELGHKPPSTDLLLYRWQAR